MPTSFTKIRIAQKDVKEIQNVVEEVGVLFLRTQPSQGPGTPESRICSMRGSFHFNNVQGIDSGLLFQLE